MDFLPDHPFWFWLVWALFTLGGLLVGWLLRASIRERRIAQALDRSEKDRMAVSRMYAELRRKNEVREADLKKLNLELQQARAEIERLQRNYNPRLARDGDIETLIRQAESKAALYQSAVASLEQQNDALQVRNRELERELQRMREEMDVWQILHRDFLSMQQRFRQFEAKSAEIEAERNALRRQVAQLNEELKAGEMPERAEAEYTWDQLQTIKGITPEIEKQLIGMGIYSYAQISRWDDETVMAFARALGVSPGVIFREDWPGQARRLLIRRVS
ncbi:MAG: hypothetical protein ACK4NS_13400 [Saprospiraceae bacterium]